MKKFISLICLFTLVLTMAMPMQFASADAEPVNVGAEEFAVGGITYIASAVDDDGNAKVVKGPFDFQDENGVPELDSGTTIYNSTKAEDAEKAAASYATVDYSDSDIPGIRDNIDPDRLKGVFLHKGSGPWDAMYIFPNSTFSIKGGVAVINYDIFYTGDLNLNSQVTQINVKKETDGTEYWCMKMMTRPDTETGKVKYTFQTKHNDAASEADIGIVEPNKWYNITLMIDIDADTYTVLFDGVPMLVNCPFVEKISGLNRMYGYRASNSDVLWDNFKFYVYYPHYEITAINGVSGDELTENVSYEKGSQVAIQFNTVMKADEFAGDVALRLKDGCNVGIEEIEESDYDAATRTLYITTTEALKPDAEYEVVLKGDTTDPSGKHVFGVVTANNLSRTEDYVASFTTEATPYGVEEITYDTLTPGGTVNATIPLRTDAEVQDANLVLVLYVDGALRSISSTEIDADSLESSYTLPINVPSDAGEYKVCAMLMDSNYQIIDMIYAE